MKQVKLEQDNSILDDGNDGQTMIAIRQLSYSYPAFENRKPVDALIDINLEIGRGEFVAILGHNGSGKSTLAKLLNAQMKPSFGDIEILGMNTRDESKLWDIRANCGIIFQNPDNQLVATIVEEDVAFGPENLGIEHPELRDRVDYALRTVGMYDYRSREPHQLSGGQKQRVAIAGVLAMKPSCIIMDEPTAMLDPIGRREIMSAIRTLHERESKTIVLITHFMEEAVHADRVIVINNGQIALSGTPREVFAQVDTMKALGLDIPQVTELGCRLHAEGFDVPADVLTVDELLEVF